MRVPRNREAQSGAVLIIFGLTVGGILLARLTPNKRRPAFAEAAPADDGGGGGLASYIPGYSSARRLVNTGLDVHNAAGAYGRLMSSPDPQTGLMLGDSVGKTTNLIDGYKQTGLTNMPAVPNVAGLNTLMRLPDKLLRAELSMLQEGIRMAEEMRARPIQATINTPRGLATMFTRMAEQFNQ